MKPSRFGAHGVMAIALFVSALATGCKQSPQVSTVAYVIGPNDIQTLDTDNQAQVDQTLLYAEVLIATAVNDTKRKFCSGSLIAPADGDTRYRVITNHHCFAPDEDDKNKVPDQLLPTACTSTKIYLGFFRDDIAHREVVDCAAGSLHTDYQGDLAVFALKANPTARFKPVSFWAEADVPAGRKASIVHFPTIDATDPDADKNLVLEPTSGIRLPVAQITLNDCETGGAFAPDEWGLDKSLKMGIKHSCDLKKGSSGSALWDNETHTILGVNWGGITLKYTDPDRTEVFNVATEAKYVTAFLANQQQSELDRLSQIATSQQNSADAQLASGHQATVKKKGLAGCATIAASAGENDPPAWVLGLLLGLPLFSLTCGRLRRMRVGQ